MGVILHVTDKSRGGCPLPVPTVKKIVSYLSSHYAVRGHRQIDLTFCDNRFIKRLNERYFRISRPTDVIVFDLSDEHDPFWGDMFISVTMARIQSRVFKTTYKHECALYIIHGFLHLLGYSDKGPKRLIMKREEEKLLHMIIKKKII